MIKDFFVLNLLKKKKKILAQNDNIYLKLSNIRNYIITKDFVGFKVSIYNGKLFIPFRITNAMVGKKFGLFSFSKSILIKKKTSKYADKLKKK